VVTTSWGKNKGQSAKKVPGKEEGKKSHQTLGSLDVRSAERRDFSNTLRGLGWGKLLSKIERNQVPNGRQKGIAKKMGGGGRGKILYDARFIGHNIKKRFKEQACVSL